MGELRTEVGPGQDSCMSSTKPAGRWSHVATWVPVIWDETDGVKKGTIQDAFYHQHDLRGVISRNVHVVAILV